MQRLFIAFPIVSEAAQEVERVQRKLEEQNSQVPITWTRGKPHCTVAFLGDCDDATTALLKERLPALGGSGAILAQLGRVDAFPNPHHPRVLIVHIDDPSRGIAGLYEKVIQIVVDCGIGLDPGYSRGANSGMTEKDVPGMTHKRFIPHVTLGRVKQESARVQGLDAIVVQPVAFEVSEVILFASELLSEGPRHTALMNVILSEAKNPVRLP